MKFRHLDGSKLGGMDGTLYLNYNNPDNNIYFGNAAYCIFNNGANYNGVAEYANWLRTTSNQDHFLHSEWDGTYFWTWVSAGSTSGDYRVVRVERSNSSGYADYAARSANNAAFYISGYQIYVG